MISLKHPFETNFWPETFEYYAFVRISLYQSRYESFNLQQNGIVNECVITAQFSSKARLGDEIAHYKLALHSKFKALFGLEP